MAYPNDGDPKLYRILEAIRVRMAAISAPDYFSDVSAAYIFTGQALSIDGVLPALVVYPSEPIRTRVLSCYEAHMQVDIDIWGAVYATNGVDASTYTKEVARLNSDVVRAIEQDGTWGGLAVFTDIVGEDLYDNADQSTALGVVSLRVAYRHPTDNPTG